MARCAAALVLVVLACPVAWAGTPTEALQEVFARADRILTDDETADRPLERLLGIRRLVNEAFDFRSAAELASGDHWQARTAAEQEEFTWLFADLLERSVVGHMAAKAHLDGGIRIKYLIEAVDGDTARVMTSMGRRNGRELLLGYRLVDRDGVWKIRDVTLDGVSIMANYRAQLDRVLGTASFPELLTQMRAMVGKGEPVEAVTAATMTEPAETTDVAVVPSASAPNTEAAPPGPVVVASIAGAPPAVSPVSIVDLPLPAPALRVDPMELILIARVTVPSPIPPAAGVKPPRVLTTKAYWLQIAAAGTAEDTGRLMMRLRDGKHSVGVERTSTNGHPVVLVRLGPFQEAEEAVLTLLDLQTKGHDPYMVAERE